jgi:CxxC motif-containing protein (DUF1111 family)
VSGRPNYFVDGRIGRFGARPFVPALSDFNRAARSWQSIGRHPTRACPVRSIAAEPFPEGVDPMPEPELDAKDTDHADDFVRSSAPPARLPRRQRGRLWRIVFGQSLRFVSRSAADHRSERRSRPERPKTVEAYTDSCYHDMCAQRVTLCFGQATPSEFRTEPLMGLRLIQVFMHDGKAKTIEEAIRLHGGEATGALRRFEKLTPARRAALLQILEHAVRVGARRRVRDPNWLPGPVRNYNGRV